MARARVVEVYGLAIELLFEVGWIAISDLSKVFYSHLSEQKLFHLMRGNNSFSSVIRQVILDLRTRQAQTVLELRQHNSVVMIRSLFDKKSYTKLTCEFLVERVEQPAAE